MKKLFVIIFYNLICFSASGQDLIELISNRICNCIDTIENIDSLEVRLDRCINESVAVFWNSDDDEQMEHFATSDTIQNTIDSVMLGFVQRCPKVMAFLLGEKEEKFYKLSGSGVANQYYNDGNQSFNSNDYKSAEKHYLKAIREDRDFVYAYDNLGLTYNHLKDYKNSVRYFTKSLEIFPEGRFALQNQADVFLELKDNLNALKNYFILISLYPDNPEGYFGSARAQYNNEDYENALEYAFYAYKLCLFQQSENVKDIEELILLIRDKMNEQNNLDSFNKKAKAYGIPID